MILVIGESGQVANALRERAAAFGEQRSWVFLNRARLDLEFPERIEADLEAIVADLRPRLVINTAAYTAVDKAETEREKAFLINATSVGAIGRVCQSQDLPLIHFSTDYVYAGHGTSLQLESEPIAPLNVYGLSKAAGESAVTESGVKCLIFRTSWVYHHMGNNFVRTILRLAADREELNVVADQIGSPTSALALADAVIGTVNKRCLEPGFDAWGVYNLAGKGTTSWYEFACAIIQEARALGFSLRVQRVNAITTAEFPTPAHRPLNSRLNQGKLESVFGLRLPPWNDSLRDCLEHIGRSI
jgi:dTDP-4-dehydrorhamnose reductase